MVIDALTNRAKKKRWVAFALSFCLCVVTAIALFTPAGSNTLTAMQQAQESLEDFLNRSPGERSATLALKGKGGGKGFAMTDVPGGKDGPKEEALGKIFDFPTEEPGEDVAGTQPPLAGEPPVIAMVPDVLAPEGFVPPGAPPFSGGFGGGIPGGGGPGGGGPGGGGSGGGNPPPTPPVGAVPEPSTWMLLIFGFLACGGAMRRQRASRRQLYA